jgi:hypothetical protein
VLKTGAEVRHANFTPKEDLNTPIFDFDQAG